MTFRRTPRALALLAPALLLAQPAAAASRPSTMPAPQVLLAPEPTERDRAVGEACLRALGNRSGAVVALDPHDGRVIALVNPREALFRAYPPCSVFKIVVAVAGLAEGVVTPTTTYECKAGCWVWPGHGPLDLRRALGASCNPYFEWVGSRLGYEKIRRYARLLGLGDPTGVNLTGEAPGRLPLSVPSRSVPRLSSHATGITTSTLQVATLLAATINGGRLYRPQLRSARGFVPEERWRLPPGVPVMALGEGYRAAVDEGSAGGAFDADIVVAGKTGSCSGVGWFASFAPADHPEIVIVTFLRGGSGGRASQVAGEIWRALYASPPSGVIAAGGRP